MEFFFLKIYIFLFFYVLVKAVDLIGAIDSNSAKFSSATCPRGLISIIYRLFMVTPVSFTLSSLQMEENVTLHVICQICWIFNQ